MNFSCGDRKCSEFTCGHYGIKMESVRPSCQIVYFAHTQKWAWPDGQVQESEYFLAGPRKFCIIYNILSENEACRRICRPIKVRALTTLTCKRLGFELYQTSRCNFKKHFEIPFSCTPHGKQSIIETISTCPVYYSVVSNKRGGGTVLNFQIFADPGQLFRPP